MRTIAGLIVGLALGILLMYFTVSAFRVQSIRTQAPTPQIAVVQPVLPESLATWQGATARHLGETAAGVVTTGLPEQAAILVVEAPGVGAAAQATAGFREAIAAERRPRLTVAATPAEAIVHLAAAARVFCADHSLLEELLEQAGDRELPPVYTIGWSDWLLKLCAAPNPSIAGVAVVEPGTALRLLTPNLSRPAESASAVTGIRAVVLTPRQMAATFETASESPAPVPAP
jgi:hypothetical protein